MIKLHKKKHKKFALIASVSNLHHYIANLHVYHEILKIYQLKPEKGRPLKLKNSVLCYYFL